MTYNDVFYRSNIVSNIPLAFEGRKLPKSETASVMLIRVAYANKMEEYNKDMQEVLKGLKKEGFDERSQAIAEMEMIDSRVKAAKEWKKGMKDSNGKPIEKPEMPTSEEIAKAEKTRETKDEYESERKELEEEYAEARTKKAEEKVTIKNATFSKAEYAEICDLIGNEGEIEIRGFSDAPMTIAKEQFLGMIAANLVSI